jgi:hypothetical protein
MINKAVWLSQNITLDFDCESTYYCRVRPLPNKGNDDPRTTLRTQIGDKIVFCERMKSWEIKRWAPLSRKYVHLAYIFPQISAVTKGDEVL